MSINTLEKTKPRKKAQRVVKMLSPLTLFDPAVVSIRDGKRVDTYAVSRAPSDAGPSFFFDKDDGVRHTVTLESSRGQRDVCDCDGHRYGGGRECRHIAALKTLRQRGKI